MKKFSLYRILIAPVIISAIIIYIAFYSIGVVEKHLASDTAAEHLSAIITGIREDRNKYEQMKEELCSEYELRTQTLSVLVSQLPKTFSEDMTSEELRIASGADEIMITDRNGLVIFSTTPESKTEFADERFRKGLTVKQYCSTVTDEKDGQVIFQTAVTRRSGGGLVIAVFKSPALNELSKYADASLMIRRSPSFGDGTIAMADTETGKFVAHGNASLIGSDCIIPAEKFRKQKGYFSFRYTLEPSFVFYEYFDDHTVLMDIVSKEYVYTKRTLVLIWLIVLDFTVILTCFLSTRSYRKNN
ncbi:hypothetical protein [Ruminococcus sp. HUN007]|uniref:hypothetical protein n=1 Tax=Ruminococcus sp. HUN007 TaxID=1514668 RepID=UPI0005D2C340|nr:hypothetical protein [Ruminococcus sp. HUN007]